MSVEIWKNILKGKKKVSKHKAHEDSNTAPHPFPQLFPLVHTFFQGHLGGFS